MKKRKPIKLKYGGLLIAAEHFNVSDITVWKAMRYKNDTKLQEDIRLWCKENNLIKRF